MPPEDRYQQGPIAAADVHQILESREVVRLKHWVGFWPMVARHCFVENGAPIWILAEVFKDRNSTRFHETGLTASHRIQQLGPGLIQLMTMKSRIRALPAVAAKRVRQRSQHEPAFIILGKDSDTGERAQHAIQHVALHSGLSAKLVGMLRSICKQVRNSQLGRDKDRLSGPVTPDQLIHLSLEIYSFCHSASLSRLKLPTKLAHTSFEEAQQFSSCGRGSRCVRADARLGRLVSVEGSTLRFIKDQCRLRAPFNLKCWSL